MNRDQQNRLSENQVEAFLKTEFEEDQISHFESLLDSQEFDIQGVIVDVGGGVGHFAKLLSEKRGSRVRVLDIDESSIDLLNETSTNRVEALVAGALNPPIFGDERVVTINLVLHHLVGRSERATREMQEGALKAWRGKADYIFVYEYIYESFLGNLSGRLIYSITSSKILSAIASFVGRFLRSLRANTFGVGVRFRANSEWIQIFEQCGFEVVGLRQGPSEPIPLPRRALLISEIRRDSFLLRALED